METIEKIQLSQEGREILREELSNYSVDWQRRDLIVEAKAGRMKKGEAILRYIHLLEVCAGARYSDVQRFICEVNGRNYNDLEFARWSSWHLEDGSRWTNSHESIGKTGNWSYWLKEINGHLFDISKSVTWCHETRKTIEEDVFVKRLGKIKKTKRLKPKRMNRGYYGTCLNRLLPTHCYKEGGRWFVDLDVIDKDFQVVLYPKRGRWR